MLSYDNWKTSAPERKQIHAIDCNYCKTELFVGDEVLHDCVSGEKFCSKECVDKYIRENLDDVIQDILERDFSPVYIEEEEIA